MVAKISFVLVYNVMLMLRLSAYVVVRTRLFNFVYVLHIQDNGENCRLCLDGKFKMAKVDMFPL